MTCKITDTTGLFAFIFTKSDLPKLERVHGDTFFLGSDKIDYEVIFTPLSTTAIGTYTSFIKLYNKFDELIKTITINEDVVDSGTTISLGKSLTILTTTDIETGYGNASVSLTYNNLVGDIEITNTKYNEFSYSVDNVNFYVDKLPIKDLGISGTKTLYIRRNKNTLANLKFTATFTNSTRSATLNIQSINDSKGLDDWNRPSFIGTWVDFGGSYDVVQYTKDISGNVYIHGTTKSGATSTAIFNLPLGYRPSNEMRFIQIGNRAMNEIKIDSSGNVYSLTDTIEVHLNISFKI